MKFILKNICAFLVFLLLFGRGVLNAQETRVDSLLQIIKTLNTESSSASLDDTVRINALINLSKEHVKERRFSKAIKYASIAKLISEKLVKAVDISKSKIWLANSLQTIAYTFENQENYGNSLAHYKKELLLREEIGEKDEVADCLNKIGELYNLQDNVAASFEYYYKALAIIDDLNFKDKALTVYNNIGIAYDRQKNYSKALEYYNKVLTLSKEQGDKNTMGISYSNIGTVYAEQGENKQALDYFYKFLKIAEEASDKKNVAIAYLNISNVYDVEGNFKKSFEMQFKAIKIFEELGNTAELALMKANIGASYLSLAKTTSNKSEKNQSLRNAKVYLNDALALYQKTGQTESISQIYFDLSELEKLSGNFENSLVNYKAHIQYRDSLAKVQDNEKSIRAEMNYEFDQKESLTKLEQEKLQAIAKEESQKQKTLIVLFMAAFVFMAILAVFILRNNRHKQKANRIITNQKHEVERQKNLTEEKQRQILSSISYAKRIQDSILISENEITKHIPEFFITYIPKDIVSGDFYWYSKQGDDSFIVVADCTGHGVPGAFLSMVGSTLLNEIITHKKISDPSLIIKELAISLSNTLINKEKEEFNQDGMDISICRVNHKTRKIYFAGANQSIYIVDQKSTNEIKAQISSINGIFAMNKTEEITTFEWDLKPGTMVYMATDGYVDQISEVTNKKFLSSRYEKLLREINASPIEKQSQMIEETFDEWKGDSKQIDDVLVIGFKI
ncbi:tetratricopeptide repeat protein [Sediminibacterium sp.]|uniref:tetratricopeptide repeat protein n=1 Tax=Sediminibacterium sp. TaxID=1917865 RepID=UPI0027354746|nr:tetratricopeptide repeat protein [Sediminibacterium sp.]MDP3567288.1 tetratricopeptide repeat protein [Sediminibacterium sp.]